MIRGVEKADTRFRDHLDQKVMDWIRPYDESIEFDTALLGAPLSKTSISHSAAFRLPDAIRSLFQTFTPFSIHHRLDLSEHLRLVDMGNIRMHLTDLNACLEAIEWACLDYWKQFPHQRLILLGGDHAITGASLLGLAQARPGNYGILHFDAHHDVRNLQDGGRSNGTPFRTVLESGNFKGKNIVQIGIQDYVNSRIYHEYVLQHGVTVHSARQVRHTGLMTLIEQEVNRLRKQVDAIYVSFDMDVIDQSFAPAVPAPSSGGLDMWQAIEALEWLGSQPDVIGFDLVCIDPERDVRDLTVRAATTLLMSFLTGQALNSSTK
ncbi:agmatinase family protein [Alicyclobacillus sp. TC]|uniref:Formiminoglutamase n=1 Tax=Alicyclobacillus tolerans TaxID=90970 RepID=A0A1M6SQX2_9BACL|nr:MULTISPECIES: agmatinase family protein [Alicyclobacillus]QRF22913.1 agmatinase family protein [Alicyclobacillus sp. TC]SHK47056.1 formiminoglutamase [Alicyclobacillus montanus]